MGSRRLWLCCPRATSAPPTAFEDHHVVAVVVLGDLAADLVGVADPVAADARGPEADHVRVARGEPLRDLLDGRVPPDRPLAVVAGQRADRPLPLADRGELLLGGEARVGLALPHQFPDVGEVDLRAFGLGVGAVAAGAVVLVRADAEVAERGLELARRAFLEPGLVGVLDADQVDTAGLVRDVLVDGRGEHPADVQPAGRAGREAGHFGARRQLTRRVAVLPVLRLRQVGGEQRVDEVLAQHALSLPAGRGARGGMGGTGSSPMRGVTGGSSPGGKQGSPGGSSPGGNRGHGASSAGAEPTQPDAVRRAGSGNSRYSANRAATACGSHDRGRGPAAAVSRVISSGAVGRRAGSRVEAGQHDGQQDGRAAGQVRVAERLDRED